MAALSFATGTRKRRPFGNRWIVTGKVASITNGGSDTIDTGLRSIESVQLTPEDATVALQAVSVSNGTVTVKSASTTSDGYLTVVGK